MIPDGSNVTYNGTWNAPPGEDNATVVSNVALALAGDGLVSRTQPKIASSFLSGLNPLGGSFAVTLQLQVENGLGFNSPDDLIAIIRHEVYAETGSFPSSDTLPFVTVPGGTPTPTGQPAPAPGADQSGCIAGGGNDASGNFSLSCWFSNLTTKGLSTVGILTLLILVAVGLVVFYGPRRAL